ncbi:MAG: ATP-binding protein [Anaerolineales bacterium]|nr:ATP-binding protein [Anaerolineales bacterium]
MSSDTQLPNMIQISFPATLNYLSLIGPCLRALVKEASSVEEETLSYSLELAVYEICTNIVQHAYRDDSGRIDLALSLEEQPQRVIIDLCDTGQSFTLANVPQPNLEVPQEHGYGLFLVHQLMDTVAYQAKEGKNRWHLEKNL